MSGAIGFVHGRVRVGEATGFPLLRAVKKKAVKDDRTLVIIDAPPGTSCPFVAAITDVDYVILVTEPTPFGLHDLKQMLGVLDQIKAPAAVIINRDGIGDEQVELFLSQTPYPILMRIPYDDEIAIGLAEGRVLADFKPDYQKDFIRIYEFILEATEKDRVSQ